MLIRFLVSQLESHASVVVVGVGVGVGVGRSLGGMEWKRLNIEM